MTISTRHLDRELVGAALRAHDEAVRHFEAALYLRDLGWYVSARRCIQAVRDCRKRFDDLLFSAEDES